MLKITVDWLAVTFKEANDAAARYLGSYARHGRVQTIEPRHGYSGATKDENGSVVMWNGNRPEMGTHVIHSGSSLRSLLIKSGVQPGTLLADALKLGGRITRLDIAKDATDENVDMGQIWEALERGEYEGTARRISHMSGLDGGHTIYVGSRTSEKFMRLYDKAVEQKIDGGDWKRLELELKGMVARAAARQVENTGSLTETFNAVATGMLSVKTSPEYAKFFPAGEGELSLPAIEKHTDREAWILKQVIPAARQHLMEEGMTVSLAALLAVLENWRDM